MRVRKVNRYYCDFCKKANCSKPAIESHEKHCTNNPNRVCRMCVKLEAVQKPIAELIALIPVQETYKETVRDSIGVGANAEYFQYDIFSGYEAAVEDAFPKLRAATDNCPVCIFAALRQSGCTIWPSRFDFKKEMAACFEKQHVEYPSLQGMLDQ